MCSSKILRSYQVFKISSQYFSLLAHPGKCYVKHTGVVHALGATWQVPEMVCAEATCYRSGSENKFLVAYQT